MERLGRLGVRLVVTSLVFSFAAAAPVRSAAPHTPKPTGATDRAARLYDQMSPMGALAAGVTPPDARPVGGRLRTTAPPPESPQPSSADTVVNGLSAPLSQSETSLASNPAGTVLVSGYNDARGFPDPSAADQNTLSLSGVARSTDGGTTWAPVPVGPGGLGVLPTVTKGSVFGDPSVAWSPQLGGFVYASIYVRPSDRVQGMSVSVSNADGSSWSAPREVTPAFVTGHSADKEWIAVNPDTGRILLTWTDFPNVGSVTIRAAYSDDGGLTWSAAATVATAASPNFVQASTPAFLPGSTTAYVVWRDGNASSRNIAASRSTDGGATWSAPVDLDNTSFPAEDQIVGVDRVNTSPSLAVDATTGRAYVVYQRNDSFGTGDIALRTWTGNPVAGAPVYLDADPGTDRAQFYPWVTVDQSNSRVHVGWLDQGGAPSGDLLEVMHTSSGDQGASWRPPTPVNERPFHAGFGNDTSQPNLGDYNGAVALNGTLRTTWGGTAVQPQFDEGLPARGLVSPDVYYAAVADSTTTVPVRTADPSFAETGPANGHLDTGETATVSVPLTNYVANATTGATTVTGITGTLSSRTAGVSVGTANSSYPDIAPTDTQTNTSPYAITLGPSFVPGTPIDLELDVTSAQGTAALLFRFESGTPGTPKTILSENFESATPPALPTGWTSNLGAGSNVPWVSGSTFTPSNAAFHSEGTTTSFMRLFSPIRAIPPTSLPSWVTLDFDLTYNLEDEPADKVLAYDGLTLRLTDSTGGPVLRSVLAEAFAQSLTTGGVEGFPKHLPRSQDQSYFQDMAVWSGDSGGVEHVSIRFPGAGLAGRTVQLRFEYTQDSSGACAVGSCGVAIDNVVMRQVPIPNPTVTTTSLSASPPSPVAHGTAVTLTADVTPSAAAGSVEFFDGAASLGSKPVSGGTAVSDSFVPAGGSHSFTAEFTPADATSYTSSASSAVPFIVDATPPTVKLTAPTAAFALAGTVRVAWSGSDGQGTGIAHFEVRTAKAPWNGGFGAYTTPPAWASLTGTSLTAPLAIGSTSCYQVRAVDKVGNVSAWSAPRCVGRPLDDRSLAASTGWQRRTGSGFYLSTYTATTRLNATLTRSGAAFDRIGIVATRCPTCGKVGIFVGSTLLGKISLVNATSQKKAILLLPKLPAVRTGKVTIKVLTSGKIIQIDGLALSRSR